MLPGVSFSPTGGVDQQGTGGTSRSAAPNSPLQDAIKILSFRMPTTVGQGAPSPLANSELGGGQVQDWLMKLFQLMPQNKQPQTAPAQQPQAASSYAPPPAPSYSPPPPSSAPASPFSPSIAPQTSYAPPQAPQIEGSAPPPDLSSIPSAPAPNIVFTPPGGRMAF